MEMQEPRGGDSHTWRTIREQAAQKPIYKQNDSGCQPGYQQGALIEGKWPTGSPKDPREDTDSNEDDGEVDPAGSHPAGNRGDPCIAFDRRSGDSSRCRFGEREIILIGMSQLGGRPLGAKPSVALLLYGRGCDCVKRYYAEQRLLVRNSR
jgi:hypothetical protein